jgi:OTU-like cysteine protease
MYEKSKTCHHNQRRKKRARTITRYKRSRRRSYIKTKIGGNVNVGGKTNDIHTQLLQNDLNTKLGRIKNDNKFTIEVIQTLDDGNCFFSAVSLAMEHDYNDMKYIQKLRKIWADNYTKTDYETYKNFAKLPKELSNFNAILGQQNSLDYAKKAIENNKNVWADEQALEHIQTALNVQFIIFQYQIVNQAYQFFIQAYYRGKIWDGEYKENIEYIFLLYSGSHYELIKINNKLRYTKNDEFPKEIITVIICDVIFKSIEHNVNTNHSNFNTRKFTPLEKAMNAFLNYQREESNFLYIPVVNQYSEKIQEVIRQLYSNTNPGENKKPKNKELYKIVYNAISNTNQHDSGTPDETLSKKRSYDATTITNHHLSSNKQQKRSYDATTITNHHLSSNKQQKRSDDIIDLSSLHQNNTQQEFGCSIS